MAGRRPLHFLTGLLVLPQGPERFKGWGLSRDIRTSILAASV